VGLLMDVKVLTDALGGSVLSKAARAGELPQWFVPVPRSADEWKRHAQAVMESVPTDWFARLEPAIKPTGAAAARLAKSAGGKGLVITTGQQPGLFGGPLMTLVKALSARALADVLQETIGIPVAPVFWAATDDADFEEAARVSLALEGGARELSLEQTSPAGTPMTRVPMGGDVERLSALLRDACGSTPHADYLTRALERYKSGATVGDAYVALLREVLEPFEIAVLDVSHESIGRASADVTARAATRAEAVAAAVKRRGEEIVAAGYTPQVDEVPGLSVVFINEHGAKRRLPQAEAIEWKASGDAWLSSTVLLRPVLERALLPTAAYVGGPGEVAYFAQVTAVADALDLPRPLVVPRWSTTIIEPRVQKMLDDLGVNQESIADPHAVEGKLARIRVPAEMDAGLRGLREGLQKELDRLARANDGVVANEVLEGVKRTIEHRLERLERRVVAGVKRRETDLMRAIGTARGALYPHGAKQERKLAWVPFLARYGPSLVDEMLAAARQHARALVGASPSLPSRKESVAAR
jgi:bacillithiol biosynthesis cysteine-adding enzyme BshC